MNRRDFLKGASLTTMGAAFTAAEVVALGQANKNKPATGSQSGPKKPANSTAQAKPLDHDKIGQIDVDIKGAPVTFAVIGVGQRGREILSTLAKMGQYAPVAMICDKYNDPRFVKRAQTIAPSATFVSDYKQVLDNKNVQGVFIATPTHQHKQIVLDAIAAGKHVYCEAPFSNSIEEAREIAKAGLASKSIFQAGLQMRCNLQTAHVHHFVLSQIAGQITKGRAQWHKNTTWRQAWPDQRREQELNWRLSRETSSGLLGEVGIHQIDTASWYLKKLPRAVTGFSSLTVRGDDRDVPDTAMAVLEYPGPIRFYYEASLNTNFDDAYEVFNGTEATIMLRDQRAWMFKEPEAAQLGWEVFARKDNLQIGKPEAGTGYQIGTGIALVADATKQIAMGKTSLTVDPTKSGIFFACAAFLKSIRAGKPVPVQTPSPENPKPPLIPGAKEGFEATVVALKANEAALEGKKVVFEKEWFTI